jgi:class 3 adenylate cyclase
MMDAPDTRYAKAPDDIHIAYQVTGEGPDLIFLPHWFSNIEIQWENPDMARFFERASSFSRLIRFDQRGTGNSDPVAIGELLTLEDRSKDITAVLDAAGSQRAFVLGAAFTSMLACYYAATNAERVTGLILLDGTARYSVADDYPIGRTDRFDSDRAAQFWGSSSWMGESPQDPWMGRYQRMSIGPGAAGALFNAMQDLDVRDVLPAIHVPTLILHRVTEGRWVPESHARYLADHIEESKLKVLAGVPSWPTGVDETMPEIEEFVTGTRSALDVDRVLATMLFTDIVESTERAASIGDRAWKELLGRHDEIAKRTIDRHRGRFVNSAGDGLLAVFDGPARAIRCATMMHDEMRALELDIRAGLHTGEIELAGNDVRGLAVHIGARVSSLAGPGETLVSSTVKDLVAGSGITFADRGMHQLKGVPDEWRLFAVES